MRVHRVRLAGLDAGRRRVPVDAAHHLTRVLRVRVGASVLAFDGAGREAPGRVTAVEGDEVWLELDAPRVAGGEPRRALTLAPALLKGDKLADVVRMGTELGVVAFRPVVARRCEVRAWGPAKQARMARVAGEAARQSGRVWVPQVHPPVPLDALTWEAAAVVADPGAELAWHEAPELAASALIVISGPEGGLTPQEVAAVAARGARPVHLGGRVLRAETAPVAMAAAWTLAVPS